MKFEQGFEQGTWTLSDGELRELLSDAHSSGAYAMTNGKWGVDHEEDGEKYAVETMAEMERRATS